MNKKNNGDWFIIVIIFIFLTIGYFIRHHKQNKLKQNVVYSICKITSAGDAHAYYSFNYRYEKRYGVSNLSYKLGRTLPFPRIGDVYIVKISRDYPDANEIQFNQKILYSQITAPELGWENIPDTLKFYQVR